jgi:hypothetical protein
MSSPKAQLSPERVAISSLQTDPLNVRIHGAKNLEAIQGSLRRFGQQKPLVVDADGIVLACNGTLEAARALGWTHLEVVRTQLRGADARAFAIADNRTAELAEWDVDGLTAAFAELGTAAVEGTGFDARDVEIMLAPPVEDPDGQWKGMPTHGNDGEEVPHRTLKVFFRSEADLQAFALLLKQTIRPPQKWLWFPEKPHALHEVEFRGSPEPQAEA